jgi:hypothetical protein
MKIKNTADATLNGTWLHFFVVEFDGSWVSVPPQLEQTTPLLSSYYHVRKIKMMGRLRDTEAIAKVTHKRSSALCLLHSSITFCISPSEFYVYKYCKHITTEIFEQTQTTWNLLHHQHSPYKTTLFYNNVLIQYKIIQHSNTKATFPI